MHNKNTEMLSPYIYPIQTRTGASGQDKAVVMAYSGGTTQRGMQWISQWGHQAISVKQYTHLETTAANHDVNS